MRGDFFVMEEELNREFQALEERLTANKDTKQLGESFAGERRDRGGPGSKTPRGGGDEMSSA